MCSDNIYVYFFVHNNGRNERAHLWVHKSQSVVLTPRRFITACLQLASVLLRNTEICRSVMDCKPKNVISSTLNGLPFHFTECLLASETQALERSSTWLTSPPLIIHSCTIPGLQSALTVLILLENTGLPPLEPCLIHYWSNLTGVGNHKGSGASVLNPGPFSTNPQEWTWANTKLLCFRPAIIQRGMVRATSLML